MKLYLGCYRNILEEGQHDFNRNKINLSKSITIKFRDKFKIRHMMEREPLLFHIMLRQGFNCFTLASGNPPTETVSVNLDTFPE